MAQYNVEVTLGSSAVFSLVDHTHELDELDATGITSGYVLAADGADGAAFVAPGTIGSAWDGHTELSDVSWTDFVVSPNAISANGGTALTYTTWKTNQLVLYFDTGGGEYGYFSLQLPHGYAAGQDIHPHIHFTTPSSIAAGETVVFRLTYTGANVGGTFPATATVDMTYTNDTGSAVAADSHLIAGGATIDGSALDLSAVFHCRLERLSSDTYAGNAYVMSMDFHMPFNRLGSENEYTG